MTDREALLQCYHSGQMSAAQFERHCEDDPELRTMVEAPRAMTDQIAAMREALEECANDLAAEIENRYGNGIKDHPAMTRKYRRDMESVTRARAALAAYDATGAPSRQSADIEAMAREIAKRASSGDALAQSRIEGRVLSFAARVAADQRERDAKIAETPDPQLANKTAAQIAAAIRASAKPF